MAEVALRTQHSDIWWVFLLQGDASISKQLDSTMVDFDPRFEIMPGTKARGTEVVHADPYEAVPRQTIAE